MGDNFPTFKENQFQSYGYDSSENMYINSQLRAPYNRDPEDRNLIWNYSKPVHNQPPPEPTLDMRNKKLDDKDVLNYTANGAGKGHPRDIETIYHQMTSEKAPVISAKADMWMRAEQLLLHIGQQLQDKTKPLLGADGHGGSWDSDAARLFAAQGPGATMQSINMWLPAVKANHDGLRHVADTLPGHQQKIQSLWDEYNKTMGAVSQSIIDLGHASGGDYKAYTDAESRLFRSLENVEGTDSHSSALDSMGKANEGDIRNAFNPPKGMNKQDIAEAKANVVNFLRRSMEAAKTAYNFRAQQLASDMANDYNQGLKSLWNGTSKRFEGPHNAVKDNPMAPPSIGPGAVPGGPGSGPSTVPTGMHGPGSHPNTSFAPQNQPHTPPGPQSVPKTPTGPVLTGGTSTLTPSGPTTVPTGPTAPTTAPTGPTTVPTGPVAPGFNRSGGQQGGQRTLGPRSTPNTPEGRTGPTSRSGSEALNRSAARPSGAPQTGGQGGGAGRTPPGAPLGQRKPTTRPGVAQEESEGNGRGGAGRPGTTPSVLNGRRPGAAPGSEEQWSNRSGTGRPGTTSPVLNSRRPGATPPGAPDESEAGNRLGSSRPGTTPSVLNNRPRTGPATERPGVRSPGSPVSESEVFGRTPTQQGTTAPVLRTNRPAGPYRSELGEVPENLRSGGRPVAPAGQTGPPPVSRSDAAARAQRQAAEERERQRNETEQAGEERIVSDEEAWAVETPGGPVLASGPDHQVPRSGAGPSLNAKG